MTRHYKKAKRPKKKKVPPEPLPTFSGTLRVISTPQPRGKIQSDKVAVHYEFNALVTQPPTAGVVQVRTIRERAGEHLHRALPGAIVHFDGLWSTRYRERELHVTRGQIIRQATTLPDYRPHERPDGTWRWQPYKLETNAQRFDASS